AVGKRTKLFHADPHPRPKTTSPRPSNSRLGAPISIDDAGGAIVGLPQTVQAAVDQEFCSEQVFT
ncbi:hypothetical protein, partial [Mycobacterium sp. 1245111.1]|uniref:hypothetical protein n=1 Tax=Mycobacterium sp. 1245111.1 TaxID=1834073 RepID=UPI000AC0D7DE